MNICFINDYRSEMIRDFGKAATGVIERHILDRVFAGSSIDFSYTYADSLIKVTVEHCNYFDNDFDISIEDYIK